MRQVGRARQGENDSKEMDTLEFSLEVGGHLYGVESKYGRLLLLLLFLSFSASQASEVRFLPSSLSEYVYTSCHGRSTVHLADWEGILVESMTLSNGFFHDAEML